MPTTSFWKFASDLNGIYTLEDAFVKWASQQNFRINELQNIWKDVNNDVLSRFGIRDTNKTALQMTVEEFQALKGENAPKKEETATAENAIGGIYQKPVIKGTETGMLAPKTEETAIGSPQQTQPKKEQSSSVFDALNETPMDKTIETMTV